MKISSFPVLDLTQTSPAFRTTLERAETGDYGLYGVDSLMRAILTMETTETCRALASLGVTAETFERALAAVQGKVKV